MFLGVVGSRAWKDEEMVYREIDSLALPKHSTIVSGGAVGVDTIAQKYAKDRGMSILVIYPDYTEYGKAAPLIRNKLIVQKSDAVVAFSCGDSRGTAHTAREAQNVDKLLRHFIGEHK